MVTYFENCKALKRIAHMYNFRKCFIGNIACSCSRLTAMKTKIISLAVRVARGEQSDKSKRLVVS
jgi:hypothetical protein